MNRINTIKSNGNQPVTAICHACNIPVILKFTLFASLLLGLAACEKVIQLDLKDSSPKIVIQGNIYDHAGPYTVTLSSSVNFDASSAYPPVTGAKVVISDNLGQSEVLSETIGGTYVTSRLRGIPGRIYSLSVTAGTQSYQASALMPPAVKIDSIFFSSSPFSGETLTTIQLTDPPLSADYYRMIYFINKVQQKEFYVLDDELFQGSTIFYSLHPRGSDTKLLKGDSVTVWLETVDPGVYKYFRSAGSESGASASPANPASNISNGALGYFNASSVRKLSAVLKN